MLWKASSHTSVPRSLLLTGEANCGGNTPAKMSVVVQSPFREETNDNSGMDFTRDGSTDLKKRPALRSSTGLWKACFFLIGYELLASILYGGIHSNLVEYLTKEMHQGTLTAVKTANAWAAVVWIAPFLGAFFGDTQFGRYKSCITFNLILLLGMLLLTVCASFPSLRPPACESASSENCEKANSIQVGLFYFAIYTIAVGFGAMKPNAVGIGADQFDKLDEKENLQKASFFNWYSFTVSFGLLIGQTCVTYLQDNLGFGWGYGLLILLLLVASVLLLAGTPFYRHKWSSTNPFKEVLQVFVAACRKWKAPSSSDSSLECHLLRQSRPSSFLRCLDRAAIQEGPSNGPWSLCTFTQVEDTKALMTVLLYWMFLLICGEIQLQKYTLFVKQATSLKRAISIFNKQLEIPAGSISGMTSLSAIVAIVLYERFLVKVLAVLSGNPRGLTAFQRTVTGNALYAFVMVVASVVDAKRIETAKEYGLTDDPDATVPLSVFILAPQLILLGISDAVLWPGLYEFFYEESPNNMKSLSNAFALAISGAGSLLDSALLTLVSYFTVNSLNGERGWIQDNLNASCFYCYYALLAVLASICAVCIVVLSSCVFREETYQRIES